MDDEDLPDGNSTASERPIQRSPTHDGIGASGPRTGDLQHWLVLASMISALASVTAVCVTAYATMSISKIGNQQKLYDRQVESCVSFLKDYGTFLPDLVHTASISIVSARHGKATDYVPGSNDLLTHQSLRDVTFDLSNMSVLYTGDSRANADGLRSRLYDLADTIDPDERPPFEQYSSEIHAAIVKVGLAAETMSTSCANDIHRSAGIAP